MTTGFLIELRKGIARLALENGSMMDVPSDKIPKGVKPGMDVNVGQGGKGGASITATAPPAPTSKERTANTNPNAQQLRGAAARQQYVMRKIIDHGWSPEQAAGVVGRFMQESFPDLRTNVKGDREIPGGSMGIGQWNRERLVAGRQFAKSQGKDFNDLDTQIDFWNHEIRTSPSERMAFAALQRADTAEEASAAMMHYERPRGWTASNPRGGHGFGNTVRNANAVLGLYDPSRVVDLASAGGSARGAVVDPGSPGGESTDPGDLNSIIDPFENNPDDPAGKEATLGDSFQQDPLDMSMLTEADLLDENRSAARRQENFTMMQQGVEAVSGGLPRLPTLGDLFADNKF